MRRILVGVLVCLGAAAACTSDDPGQEGDDGGTDASAGASGNSPSVGGGGTAAGVSGVAGAGAVGNTGGMVNPEDPPGGAGNASSAGFAGHGGDASGAGGTGLLPTDGGTGGADNPDPVSGPVNGVVLSGATPQAGIVVVIDGVSKLTGSDGTFSFDDVPSSYQLTLLSSVQKSVLVLDGMKGRSPTIQFKVPIATPRKTSINASVTGAQGFPTDLKFIADDGRVLGSNSTFGSYTLHVQWAGEATQHGKIWAVRPPHAGPVWRGFASREVTLTNGVPIVPTEVNGAGGTSGTEEPEGAAGIGGSDWHPPVYASEGDLVLEPPSGERVVRCGGAAPESFVITARVALGPFRYSIGGADDAGMFDCIVPEGVDLPASVEVAVLRNVTGGAHLFFVSKPIPASGDLTVALEAPSAPVLPVAAATGVTTATEFSWTKVPDDTVPRVTFSVGGWSIARLAIDVKTTIPDLTAYGVPLPKNATGTWLVSTRGPATTVDEVARLEDVPNVADSEWQRIGPSYRYGITEYRTFKTAP